MLQRAEGLDKPTAQLIAYAIAGLHAGLPDRNGEIGKLNARPAGFASRDLDAAWRAEIAPVTRDLAPAAIGRPPVKSVEELAFLLSVLGRMIFSCLVAPFAGAWIETSSIA